MALQDTIDRDVRMLVGDLQVQLMFARARITELEEQVKVVTSALHETQEKLATAVTVKPNGKTGKDAHPQGG